MALSEHRPTKRWWTEEECRTVFINHFLSAEEKAQNRMIVYLRTPREQAFYDAINRLSQYEVA